MSWKALLADNRVEAHTTSRQELDGLRSAADRTLHDAALPELSADNKLGLAYEAALLMAKMAIACAGYRVKGYGAHQTTFVALELAMGPAVSKEAAYFDSCRRKRHTLSYDTAGVATDTEAAEILERATRFRQTGEDWISKHHPGLSRPLR